MSAWLFKSEPDVFSIEDLRQRGARGEPWDGVRNYQARNFMRDAMHVGDPILFYHSNCKIPGVVGLAEVISEAFPDTTAFDPESNHFDPKSSPDHPRWVCVQVRFVKAFPSTVSLASLRADPVCQLMQVARKGNRLSITPVQEMEFNRVLELAKIPASHSP